MGRGDGESSLSTEAELPRSALQRSASVFERAQISLPEKLYHVSSAAAADEISRSGLCAAPIGFDRPGGLTMGGEWADTLYGVRPVYLSVSPWEIEPSERAAHALFEVRSSEIDLALCSVDAPSLIDHGMSLTSEEIYWEEGDPTGDQIHELLGEQISKEALLDSAELTRIAFELTSSLAISGDVPPSALRRVGWPS